MLRSFLALNDALDKVLHSKFSEKIFLGIFMLIIIIVLFLTKVKGIKHSLLKFWVFRSYFFVFSFVSWTFPPSHWSVLQLCVSDKIFLNHDVFVCIIFVVKHHFVTEIQQSPVLEAVLFHVMKISSAWKRSTTMR